MASIIDSLSATVLTFWISLRDNPWSFLIRLIANCVRVIRISKVQSTVNFSDNASVLVVFICIIFFWWRIRFNPWSLLIHLIIYCMVLVKFREMQSAPTCSSRRMLHVYCLFPRSFWQRHKFNPNFRLWIVLLIVSLW